MIQYLSKINYLGVSLSCKRSGTCVATQPSLSCKRRGTCVATQLALSCKRSGPCVATQLTLSCKRRERVWLHSSLCRVSTVERV